MSINRESHALKTLFSEPERRLEHQYAVLGAQRQVPGFESGGHCLMDSESNQLWAINEFIRLDVVSSMF